jgi:hypothetical protein
LLLLLFGSKLSGKNIDPKSQNFGYEVDSQRPTPSRFKCPIYFLAIGVVPRFSLYTCHTRMHPEKVENRKSVKKAKETDRVELGAWGSDELEVVACVAPHTREVNASFLSARCAAAAVAPVVVSRRCNQPLPPNSTIAPQLAALVCSPSP